MNSSEYKQAIDNALFEATLIAEKAKFGAYVQNEISDWGKKYVYSRVFGFTGDSQGYFDKVDAEFMTDISKTWNDFSVPPHSSQSFYGEATGESKDSMAVLSWIGYLRVSKTPNRIDRAFSEYESAKRNDEVQQAVNVYLSEFRDTLLGFSTLFNTMQKKMDQAAKPRPVPGPGDIIVSSPFGDVIVSGASRTVGSLTVGEFVKLMNSILGK